jgi:hypothetical protein
MRADKHDAAGTYATKIDADDGAYEALLALEPMSSLASRLSALGIDARAVSEKTSETASRGEADGARERRFTILWRPGPRGEIARISWRFRLSESADGATLLSLAVRARAADDAGRKRVVAGWPALEAIALAHAKGLRRAIDDYADDPSEAERPPRPALLQAAA